MKILRYFPVMLILSVVILLTPGCKKDDNTEELKADEMRLLDQYLADKNITTEPTASGLYYIVLEEGDGPQPVNKDFLEVEYLGELVDGTVFSTTSDSIAQEEEIYDEEIIYGLYRFQLGYTLPGLNEGIAMMHQGEKAMFILPSDLALGGTNVWLVKAYSTLIYTIKLVNVIHDPDEWELEILQAYLDTLRIDQVASLDSVYYIETTPGSGPLIENQDVVEVYYTGYYLDGRVFDTNVGGTVFSFSVPQPYLIEGWNEGIRKMRNGSKGSLIIPYKKGYGATGMVDRQGRTKVGPYMTIVFDLEIVDVR